MFPLFILKIYHSSYLSSPLLAENEEFQVIYSGTNTCSNR